ncbi:Transporter [Brevinematales bacterium NS]|jgi:hypothetical protein|nr:hypothetical protein [Brevinematales bacterium]QJR22203.1 Transporter [Brevinematales bacterium NS]
MNFDFLFYETIRIGQFIWNSFLHIWWLLLITIPLAVWININDMSNYVKK